MVPLCDSVAQTALHPANVVKTLLQTKGSFGAILPLTWATLSRGAGAQFLLSLPNGALHFAVLEVGDGWWATRNRASGIYKQQFLYEAPIVVRVVSDPVPRPSPLSYSDAYDTLKKGSSVPIYFRLASSPKCLSWRAACAHNTPRAVAGACCLFPAVILRVGTLLEVERARLPTARCWRQSFL